MSQKHIGITLDNPLSFGKHLRLAFGKTNRTWVCCYANFNISSQDLHFLLYIKLLSDHILIMVTLYMKKLTSNPFSRKQNLSNITHVYTGALSNASEEKLCDELGLETLQLCRWFRKLYYLKNFYKNKSPQSLSKLVPLRHSPYTTRNTENIPLFKTKHSFFKYPFFLSAAIEWNSFDHNSRNVRCISAFKINIQYQFIRSTPIVYLTVKIIEDSNLLQDCV